MEQPVRSNKYALVTGATSGIGYEIAKLFANDGHNLIIVSRFQDHLDITASEFRSSYGIEVITILKDLSHENAPFELYSEIKEKGIKVDFVVNNAAQGEFGDFINTDIQRELEIIRLNVMSYLVLTKLFLKEMVERNEGKVLQVASIGGKLPGPELSVYHATKAFIVSHTAAIAEELKETNVTVTALLPGPTETDFFNKAGMEHTKMVQEGPLSDPSKVAKDGYEALMKGDTSVISGFQNKLQVLMGNVLPDETTAKMVGKQLEPSEKSK